MPYQGAADTTYPTKIYVRLLTLLGVGQQRGDASMSHPLPLVLLLV